ncbi:UPF0104 family protein [Rhodoblastus acidophilus]|uniref:UPF0104 family protein n=1 Tax=Candidatus Rhodoblastus alkanivorans TaxID=2954117 RepID=A0ABS9Z3R3_9HYPH|nr:UPF0104 family protein [Candidatus Rhodoblastus alkanivorans]MCI4682263.1 UPF0104 family protein [Candidatus Rhodoblastus alkanivorans]MDI4639565.1 UPF0104 family protein [Rhodoblastus acidophilus]
MKRNLDYIWPALGFAAVLVSFWLLFQEFRGQSLGPQLIAAFEAIPMHRYALAFGATVVAYVALAYYDWIALLHLNVRHISWRFIAACSFTTYALSHNIGASVVSGAMVRYRGYATKGLKAAQVAVLVAVCSLTFLLGELLVGGIALLMRPRALAQLDDLLPAFLTHPATARVIGLACLGVVALYIAGSLVKMPSLTLSGVRIAYPKWGIVVRQLIAAPAEILGAAGIIYYALPAAGNPGFLVVVAVFIFSFSAALASNAPGGLGVFEIVFLKSMPGSPQDGVLAALLLFRLLYLLIPLGIAIFVVLNFERRRLAEAIEHHHHMAEGKAQPAGEKEREKLGQAPK